MNVSDFYEEIGRLLNDPSNDRWPEATLLDRINHAQTVILAYSNAVKTKESLTPVAGTETVSLNTNTMDIIRVHIKNASGEWKKLPGILRDALDFEDPGWRNRDDGEPLAYTWDGTNQQIILIPAPNSDWAQSDGLEVWEVQKPTTVASDSDVPFGSNTAMIPYHMAITHWVVAQCWMDDGTPEALQKARFHRSGLLDRPGEFEMQIKRLIAKFDAPEDIPARVMWSPQGGRIGGRRSPSKSYPFIT